MALPKMSRNLDEPRSRFLTLQTDLEYLAGGARKKDIVDKYGEINNWDVSNVTDMYKMFEEATSFNQPLNKWNVSNVKNMHGMFANASSFNQPLNSWNVSNVTNMRYMFYHARSFNQPLN